jgi:hypothetical protein
LNAGETAWLSREPAPSSLYDLFVARVTQARVSLLRWLRRQLAQPTPVREHLEAAVMNDDPREARRLLEGFAFSEEQRRHVAGLIDAWEREATPPSA